MLRPDSCGGRASRSPCHVYCKSHQFQLSSLLVKCVFSASVVDSLFAYPNVCKIPKIPQYPGSTCEASVSVPKVVRLKSITKSYQIALQWSQWVFWFSLLALCSLWLCVWLILVSCFTCFNKHDCYTILFHNCSLLQHFFYTCLSMSPLVLRRLVGIHGKFTFVLKSFCTGYTVLNLNTRDSLRIIHR